MLDRQSMKKYNNYTTYQLSLNSILSIIVFLEGTRMLAKAYIKDKKMFVHYEKEIIGERTGMRYDIGMHLMDFLSLDIESVRGNYREMAKVLFHPDFSIENMFKWIDVIDEFCPYLHFYTHSLIGFCLDYYKDPMGAFACLFGFADDVANKYDDKIRAFCKIYSYGEFTSIFGNNPPITMAEFFDAVELAISGLMDDIKIKRGTLAEEIEFIQDESIDTKDLDFMQKLYLLDFNRKKNGKTSFYTNYILTSHFMPDSNKLNGLKSLEEIKETMIKENINVVQMYDLLFMGDLIRLELMGIVENNMPIKKCKYCKRYFVPIGRTDIEYCTMIPDGETKPCNEIGAIKNYSKSVASDPANQLYLKAYRRMNSKARTKRITQLHFLEWSDEARSKRNLCKEGGITIEEFKVWLDADKTKKGRHV